MILKSAEAAVEPAASLMLEGGDRSVCHSRVVFLKEVGVGTAAVG